MKQQHSFIRVTIYFGLFATFAAGLIGLGRQSWNLPLLVGFCSILSIVYTDILGWFSLNRWVVYVAMIAGAGIAITDFFGDATKNQIMEVGNLLVYVQLPLMFQQKSKRVFEQWGVFLLLELVVGALVNNNLLYGLLMLPVLVIGCAAMMALAQFASHLRHSESISESTTIWARLLHWLGKEQLVTKLNSGVRLSAVEPVKQSGFRKSPFFAPSRLGRGIMPLAFSVLLFSIAYFYSLPRLSMTSYQGSGIEATRVGFNEQISLRSVGKLLRNEAPLFRMSMRDARKNTNYRPELPPYIRASVSHRYIDGPRMGEWQPGEPGLLHTQRIMRAPPLPAQINQSLANETDSVIVSIIEKGNLGDVVPTIAPFAQSRATDGFSLVRRDWRMVDTRESVQLNNNQKRRYSYFTYAFKDGIESPLLPDLKDCLRDDEENGSTMRSRFGKYQKEELLDFPDSLRPIIPFRDKILAESTAKEGDRFAKAIFLEEYLANGPDFKYTLSLTAPLDRNIDPIVDFLLNKRKGHCQYFASALAMLLRSLDIPTRLVVGFRPSEYNDLGEYFLVQQSHAHVWVEAYFTVEELTAHSIPVPSYIEQGAWMRLDGTPPGDNSNAGGAFRSSGGQTIGMMQEFWSEMILNMDKSKQSTIFSVFGETSDGYYTEAWLNLKIAVDRIQNNQTVGFLMSPARWFSWQIALGVTAMGIFAVLLYRLLLLRFPNWVPRIRLRSAFGKSHVSSVDFYNRAVRLLNRIGFKRSNSQTQREFFQVASTKLSERSVHLDADLLSRLFYELRFGGLIELSVSDQALVDSALFSLESDIAKLENLSR